MASVGGSGFSFFKVNKGPTKTGSNRFQSVLSHALISSLNI